MGLIRMLMLVFVGLLVYGIYKKVRGSGSTPRVDAEDERLGRLVQDPQCQVYLDFNEAIKRKTAAGEWFFCSEKCAEEYTRSQA